jgi:hypothetical protein
VTVFAFLGPTLPAARAREILEVEVLPPARAGDLCALLHGERKVSAVALVDGLFQQTPAIWHKEILFALSRGISVYGSSSMGALRAAELHAFGMIGVGRVFEAYLSLAYEDDDEVAVVHGEGEHGFVPLSDPMVNLRHGLAAAREANVIAAATEEVLSALAKSWFYPDRSWRRIFAEAAAHGVPAVEVAALRGFVETTKPDRKRDDAVLLFERIARDQRDGFARERVSFDFEPTKYWEALVAAVVPPKLPR